MRSFRSRPLAASEHHAAISDSFVDEETRWIPGGDNAYVESAMIVNAPFGPRYVSALSDTW